MEYWAKLAQVNNPLEAITNLIYLTKSQKNDPALVSQNMEIVEQQLAVLGKVTTQALTFHRTQTEAQNWDLVDIAESALKLHAEKIARHHVAVDSRFERPAMTRVFGTEILQVVSNLILNALDAVPREKARISLRVRTHGQSVDITISDNGGGIPAHIAQRLVAFTSNVMPAARNNSRHRGDADASINAMSRDLNAPGTFARVSGRS